jgi:predicted  nucleic acid-binding Zn-ribbon protein
MSHGPGFRQGGDDYLYLDPKEVLAQYSVEWVALRQSFEEVKAKLLQVQTELTALDQRLRRGEITEQEHLQQYRERWATSTQMIEVKREVEARLYDIQREIRAANKKLKEMEEERLKRDRMEQERSNAMVEWMALKQGFDLVTDRRREITTEMDKIELRRRAGKISDAEYRGARVAQIRQLAELRTLETDIKNRLGELLQIIRK